MLGLEKLFLVDACPGESPILVTSFEPGMSKTESSVSLDIYRDISMDDG